MENSGLVSLRNIGDFGERWIGPNGKLVVGNSVRGHNFAGVRIEDQRGHLGGSDERVETGGGLSVPEVNGTI